MKHAKHYQQDYSNLCAVLGDLILKEALIKSEIQQIKNKINNLQAAQPILAKIEQELTKESQHEQETTNTPKIG